MDKNTNVSTLKLPDIGGIQTTKTPVIRTKRKTSCWCATGPYIKCPKCGGARPPTAPTTPSTPKIPSTPTNTARGEHLRQKFPTIRRSFVL